MKFLHLPFSAAVALSALSQSASAAIVFAGGTISETFDALPATGNTPLADPSIGAENALPGTSFEGAKQTGTGSSFSLIADEGSSNSGSLHSYGAIDDPERALGSLGSGGNTPAFGLEIVNNTSAPLVTFTVSGFREQWRSSTTNANTIAFSYGTTQSGLTSATYLDPGAVPGTPPDGFTPLPTFDLVGDNISASTNGPLDGNANRIAISGVITGILVAPNESLFLRFDDLNDVGFDAGLALDDFSAMIPEPTAVITLLSGAGLSLGLRRRSPAAVNARR